MVVRSGVVLRVGQVADVGAVAVRRLRVVVAVAGHGVVALLLLLLLLELLELLLLLLLLVR